MPERRPPDKFIQFAPPELELITDEPEENQNHENGNMTEDGQSAPDADKVGIPAPGADPIPPNEKKLEDTIIKQEKVKVEKDEEDQ